MLGRSFEFGGIRIHAFLVHRDQEPFWPNCSLFAAGHFVSYQLGTSRLIWRASQYRIELTSMLIRRHFPDAAPIDMLSLH